MRICLFEDRGVGRLEPLTLTRPGFDLLCGLSSLGDKQTAYFEASARGVLIRPLLADLYRQEHPHTPVNDLGWLRNGPIVLVNGRWLPPAADRHPIDPHALLAGGPGVGLCGDEVAYAVLSPAHLVDLAPATVDDCLDAWKLTLPAQRAGGRMVGHLWELVDLNGEQIARDFAALPPLPYRGCRPGEVGFVGPTDDLIIDPTARIDPMVVLDTRLGPIYIDRQASVTAFTRLEGPCYVGPGTQILGASVRGGCSFGPQCRIGGEIEASIVQGHSNKYHDGFLGHSYLGEWVNLGAGTQTSDLRNDYGEVSVVVGGQLVPTGRTKVGAYLGDHTKSGLGSLLNTGTSCGVFAHLLPNGRLLPKHVPSFCRTDPAGLAEETVLERLFATASRVMQRRGQAWTDAHAMLFQRLAESTAVPRRQALREAEQRRLRRSA